MQTLLDRIGGEETVEKYYAIFYENMKKDNHIGKYLIELESLFGKEFIVSAVCTFLVKESLVSSLELKKVTLQVGINEMEFNRVILALERVLLDCGEEKVIIANLLAAFLRLKKFLFSGY